jgi:tripartite-type tricarboxylate transporter receptor subunit TctC
MHIKTIMSLLIALLVSIVPALSQAADWPTRPVRVVVPYPAGGNADVVARIVAQALQERLHQPFVIENKVGAGGIIGTNTVIHAAPDGHTLLFSANGPILFAPELVDPRPYDWETTLTPVSTVSLTPLVVVVHPKFPAQNFKDFLAYAESKGDKLSFGAGGMGTINHLFSELMQDRLKVKWTTVQYKGTAPAMTDLIGGHVQFSIDQVSSAAPFIKQGAVKALVVTSKARSSALPDVPTLNELGYPDLVGYTFTAVMAPLGTPKDVVSKLHAALATVLNDENVRHKLEQLGADPDAMPPDQFKAFLERESATWTPIVRKARTQ